VDLERNPLISLKDRAFILRRLRRIREQRRPCLEACLRFLLFAREDADAELPAAVDSESPSSDDFRPVPRKEKDLTISLLRNNKNLAEPRTSQGVFGPNGKSMLLNSGSD
jgi:WD repeat-containing protein 59